jgi:hypothetical protein
MCSAPQFGALPLQASKIISAKDTLLWHKNVELKLTPGISVSLGINE